jgi:hypothetical protein
MFGRISLPLILAAGAGAFAGQPRCAEDPRSFMHGIEAVALNDGSYRVFFSSSGVPPTGPKPNGNWPHDVYASTWRPGDAGITPPNLFIRKPEAQEPVSAARTANGRIMLSFEDGWNTDADVNQRYGIYNDALQPIVAYPKNVKVGGHSGHVAATDEHFVVFYSEGWINGGGVDNLGTGNGVYAKVYRPDGSVRHTIDVARKVREWWPVLAASSRQVMLVWQQYVPGELYANLRMATLNPATGQLREPVTIAAQLQYYTYAVTYVPSIARFLVTGTHVDGRGFAMLYTPQGQAAATLPCMPATVREGGVALRGNTASMPTADNRVMHLQLDAQQITLTGVQPSPLTWSTVGSIGLASTGDLTHWVSLTAGGVQEADTSAGAATPPTADDLCR